MPKPISKAPSLPLPRNGDPANTLELCVRYGTTPVRRAILLGLLQFRDALRKLQVGDGFQWVDAAFLDDDRRIRNAPDCIRVVTFCYPSPVFNDPEYADLVATVTNRKATLAKFKVDHMPVLLTWAPRVLVKHTRVHSALLSCHQDNGTWKAPLELDLNTLAEDTTALQHLASLQHV